VGTVFFPLDQRIGLEAYRQTTRRLERLVCAVGIRLPYDQSAEVVEELLGVQVSGRQVEHLVDQHGQRAIARRSLEVEAAWRAPEPVGRQPAGPEVLYIEADGALINSREGQRMEGKVGLVHQGPEPVGRNRMRLRSAVYVTTFQGSERLGEELYLEADRQGLERAGQVVFLSDGAQGLRDIHRTHFYDAVCLLDWFHLRRELYRALRGAAAELGDDYEAAARMTLKDLLWFGELDLALVRLDRLRGRLAGRLARDAITAFKRYVLNNQDGIGYADLYEQGLHVGSGPIEKAADLIINRRCELRGMTWYRDTADGICNLRALHFNGPQCWRAFWSDA
jgi:hypothetical protein